MPPAFLPADPLERFAYRISPQYAIERELARGGNGLVLLARDLRHARQVAIKLVHPELALTMAAERFEREIRLAASLRHPHVLPLLDAGVAGDTAYSVLPYIAGGSLRDRLDREGQLPLHDALAIARQAAGALAGAHRAGIIHRDVKPGNLLLDGSHVYVTDFGVACVIDAHADDGFTTAGMSIGTPAYMSPEQTTGEGPVDGRTDVYSLGVVLYEMLTGALPFPGGWARSALFRHVSPSAPSPYIRRPDLPRRVAQLVRRALAERPVDRFQSAGALAAALDEAIAAGTAVEWPARWGRGLTSAARTLAVRLCGFA